MFRGRKTRAAVQAATFIKHIVEHHLILFVVGLTQRTRCQTESQHITVSGAHVTAHDIVVDPADVAAFKFDHRQGQTG